MSKKQSVYGFILKKKKFQMLLVCVSKNCRASLPVTTAWRYELTNLSLLCSYLPWETEGLTAQPL